MEFTYNSLQRNIQVLVFMIGFYISKTSFSRDMDIQRNHRNNKSFYYVQCNEYRKKKTNSIKRHNKVLHFYWVVMRNTSFSNYISPQCFGHTLNLFRSKATKILLPITSDSKCVLFANEVLSSLFLAHFQLCK